MLSTKDDYFALSRQQALPNRCPLLNRCERRAHTIAIANNWDHEEAPGRLAMKEPIIASIGEPAYLIGGTNNFITGGQCPEVGLFESTIAIMGLSGSPVTSGQYDKHMNPQYQIKETGHFSECAEYIHASNGGFASDVPAIPVTQQLLPPEKVTLQWLFAHVPISYWISAATLLFAIFCLGIQANELQVVREYLHFQSPRERVTSPPANPSAPAAAVLGPKSSK
jgi:hypothetical protein